MDVLRSSSCDYVLSTFILRLDMDFFFINICMEVVIRKIISFHWLPLQILIGRDWRQMASVTSNAFFKNYSGAVLDHS